MIQKRKFMSCFEPVITPDPNDQETTKFPHVSPTRPKLRLQPMNSLRKLKAKFQTSNLKQTQSAVSPGTPGLKPTRDPPNKYFTEMSNESHPSTLWLALNQPRNNCNAKRMACEASSKCPSVSDCGPCQRIHFVLSHCEKYLNVQSNSETVSNFMNGLRGYSPVGLSKDFRHLQIYHKKKNHTTPKQKSQNVDYSNAKSLLNHIHNTLAQYDININTKMTPKDNKENELNILNAVSELMVQLKTNKDFDKKYIKLGLLSEGANGQVFVVKSWQTQQYYAMKELCFKHLNVNQMFDVLSNWRMVQQLELIGKETEMYVDASRSRFFIISHLYGGSMCGFLEETYIKTSQCLSQSELKLVLQNGVMETLKTLHDHGYIHGDIKPENLVYELNDNNTTGI
eukprot:37415_1